MMIDESIMQNNFGDRDHVTQTTEKKVSNFESLYHVYHGKKQIVEKKFGPWTIWTINTFLWWYQFNLID